MFIVYQVKVFFLEMLPYLHGTQLSVVVDGYVLLDDRQHLPGRHEGGGGGEHLQWECQSNVEGDEELCEVLV